MPEKRMLILPAELVKKVNDNRGDLSQEEFIDFLLEDRLEGKAKEQKEITKEELKFFFTLLKVSAYKESLIDEMKVKRSNNNDDEFK